MKADEHIRIRERMLLDAWRAGIRLDGVVNGVYSLDDLHRVQALLLAAGDDDGVEAARDCIASYPAAAAQRDADEARRAALSRVLYQVRRSWAKRERLTAGALTDILSTHIEQLTGTRQAVDVTFYGDEDMPGDGNVAISSITPYGLQFAAAAAWDSATASQGW